MPKSRNVAVVDIGKTNAKLVLVDLATSTEIEVLTRPNDVLPGPPYPHYDIEALWTFIVDGLKQFKSGHDVDAVTVTTHGASAALLDGDGTLASPVLDYEFSGPDELADQYANLRPDFSETGSPRLPNGLNLGAQLYWQFHRFPELRHRTKTIVTYPQYWTARLTGVMTNEVTSMGCHTDLWAPEEGRLSSMVEQLGWQDLMAPVRKASDVLGAISSEVAKATGLPESTPVYCGIHDSNASLYPHLLTREAPFSVVSTGTWVISMSIGGKRTRLDSTRDTLINVSATGDAVPSARFMGGREFERATEGMSVEFREHDIRAVLQKVAMLLPAIENESGPFVGRQSRWTVREDTMPESERVVAVSFYLALNTSVGLEMTGADGPTIVEGPFASNMAYLEMLAAATERQVIAVQGTGTSIGAALTTSEEKPGFTQAEKKIEGIPDGARSYAQKWLAEVAN